jgi:hypothetical protein
MQSFNTTHKRPSTAVAHVLQEIDCAKISGEFYAADKDRSAQICVYLWLKLTVVADCLNRTATHCLVTLRFLFLSRGLFIDKRVVVLVTAGKVIRRSVAADVAIDARRIHVIRTADVLFYFFVLVRHVSGVCHLFRNHHLIKLFTCQKTEFDGRFAQADLLLVSVLCNLGSFVVTDVRIQGGHQH